MEWINYFKSIAEIVKWKSKDESTKIGTVIVGRDNEILSTGYNSFPKGLNDNIESRQTRPIKYFYFEHAERNAIFNAAKNGIKIDGSSIYLSCGPPCADCARAIINSGIKRIYCVEIGSDPLMNKVGSKWNESCLIGLEMLEECGIEVNYYNNDLK